jgi:oligogalacturonide transport system substrate-binding protein
MYVRQKTGKPLINDDYSLGFGIDDMTNAFTYFKRLKDNEVLISANELSQTTNNQNADEIMLKEITGMICCWVSDFDKTKNKRFKGCDVSIEMPPISKDAKISAIVVKPQLILAVNQKSENKREVMKLLNWIYNNPDGIKSWGVNRGPSPTVIGSRVQQEENMVHEEISRGIKLAMDRGGSHENSLSNHGEILNIFIEINGRVFLGEVTPQEAANELVEKLVKKLKLLKKKKIRSIFVSLHKCIIKSW